MYKMFPAGDREFIRTISMSMTIIIWVCESRDGDFVYLTLLTGQCVDHYLPFKLKWSRSLQYGSLWWRWWLMARISKNTFKSLSEMCSIFVNLFRTENCILTLCGSKCHFNYLAYDKTTRKNLEWITKYEL